MSKTALLRVPSCHAKHSRRFGEWAASLGDDCHAVPIDGASFIRLDGATEEALEGAVAAYFSRVFCKKCRYENVHIVARRERTCFFARLGSVAIDAVHGEGAKEVPFGVPLLTATKSAGMSLVGTRSIITNHNGVRDHVFVVEFDMHPTAHAFSIVPVEREGYGAHPPCVSTDLVVFALCTPKSIDEYRSPNDIPVLIFLERNSKWFQPAGHVERGQTFEEAVVAEVREETGLAVAERSIKSFDVIYGSEAYDPYPTECAPLHVLYTCTIDSTIAAIPAVDGLGHQWVALGALISELSNKACEDRFRNPWEMIIVMQKFLSFAQRVVKCS